MSEFNRPPAEHRQGAEMRPFGETGKVGESGSASEYKNVSENGAGTPRKTKRKRGTDIRLLSGFLAVAAVAVAAVTIAAPREERTASILSAQATDTTITCEVEVSGEDLQLVLYNDFTRRVSPLETGVGSEQFTGLQPAMEYTLAVVGEGTFGERTLAKMTVETNALPDPVSEFYSVAYECTCAVDGYFHFTVNYIDEAGIFSDFAASLTDGYGNVSACVFTENAHEEQTIGVTVGANLMGKTAEFLLTCKRAGEDAELFREIVKI